MSFSDMIKSDVLEAFSAPVGLSQILLSILIAFAASILILVIYRMVNRGMGMNRSFQLTIMMTAMISAMIVTTITSNLALSLGMVGALSIVRFRTAIKNPLDTVFMFWSVAAGITAGAQAYFLCIFATVIIGIVVYLYAILTKAGASTYVLVVRAATAEAMDQARETIEALSEKKRLCSRNQNRMGFELVYEISVGRNTQERIDAIAAIAGVEDVSLTQCAATAI